MSRTRYRQFDHKIDQPVETYKDGTLISTTYNSTANEYDSMTDVVVSGYYSKIARGEIINNPMSYVKVSNTTTPGGYLKYSQHQKQNFSSPIHDYEVIGPGSKTTHAAQVYPPSRKLDYLSLPAEEPNLEGDSKAQALGNVDRTPYAFAEDVGEIRETLKFLRSPFSSMRDLSNLFKKDVARRQAKQKILDRAKAIADAWTEYQFAFLPLVRSAHDLIESASQKVNNPSRKTARGFASQQDSDFNTELRDGYDTWSVTMNYSCDHKAGILYEVSNPLQDWRYKYGLRFKDIPETLWALMPYSFMVDRMSNISQTIRGLTALLDPNVKILTAWHTRKSSQIRTRSWVSYQNPPWVTAYDHVPDVDTLETFEYDRAVWLPTFSDTVQSLDLKGLVDSSTKIADLAALITQRLK